MLVDPFTGQPIDLAGPVMQPGSLTGAFGMDMAESYGMAPEQNPVLFNALEHIPGSAQMMGYNAWRGSRTIRSGGWAANASSRGVLWQGVNNHLNPRSWGRFRDSAVVGGGGNYSPFNFLGHYGNKGMNRAINQMVVGRAAQGIPSPMGQRLLRSGIVGPGWTPGGANDGYFMGGGAVSRIGAASRMYKPANWHRSSFGQRGMNNVMNFIGNNDWELRRAIGWSRPAMSAADMGDLTLLSSRGTVGQMVGGYMSGVMNQAHGPVMSVAEEVAQKLGRTSFMSGRLAAHEAIRLGGGQLGRAGISHALASEGVTAAMKVGGATAARSLGYAVPGINVAMAAWTAYDVLKMGGALMGGALNLTKDAGLSLRGSINKPVMGMGYKDNAVAATSRARGVMAIQNSRLNARSVLGSEAGMMASYFG